LLTATPCYPWFNRRGWLSSSLLISCWFSLCLLLLTSNLNRLTLYHSHFFLFFLFLLFKSFNYFIFLRLEVLTTWVKVLRFFFCGAYVRDVIFIVLVFLTRVWLISWRWTPSLRSFRFHLILLLRTWLLRSTTLQLPHLLIKSSLRLHTNLISFLLLIAFLFHLIFIFLFVFLLFCLGLDDRFFHRYLVVLTIVWILLEVYVLFDLPRIVLFRMRVLVLQLILVKLERLIHHILVVWHANVLLMSLLLLIIILIDKVLWVLLVLFSKPELFIIRLVNTSIDVLHLLLVHL